MASGTSYRVYRQLKGNKSWATLKTVSDTSFIDDTAVKGKTYNYKVRAFRGNSKSPFEDDKIITVKCK